MNMRLPITRWEMLSGSAWPVVAVQRAKVEPVHCASVVLTECSWRQRIHGDVGSPWLTHQFDSAYILTYR